VRNRNVANQATLLICKISHTYSIVLNMHFKLHLIDFIRYVVGEFVLSNSLQKLSERRH